jgi:hypothetical protein
MEATMEANAQDSAQDSAQDAALPATITLGGRTFRRAESTTVDQDAYVTKRLRDSGLAKMLSDFDPRTDDLLDLNERIIFEAYERGVMYEVLAGILVEDGVPWSRARAAANATMFADITDRAEKAAIVASAADFLFDFFTVAAAFSRRSGNLTRRGTDSGDRGENGNAPVTGQESPKPNERPTAASVAPTSTTTGNGTN